MITRNTFSLLTLLAAGSIAAAIAATPVEAEKVLNRVIIDDNALRADDIERVIVAKRQAVEQDGLLEHHPPREARCRR